MAGECRARPSACASGMLGKVKAGVGHGRPQAGSIAPCPAGPNLLAAWRENVTVSLVYRRPVSR